MDELAGWEGGRPVGDEQANVVGLTAGQGFHAKVGIP